jgi:ubiquinone biosynthesis protein Coq4
VRLHDLHHLVTGYPTDWKGELEISAWEIAGSCRGYVAAWPSSRSTSRRSPG